MQSQKLKNKIDILLCTLFGLGYLKPAPGTYGSIVAMIFILISPKYYIILNGLLILITIKSYFSIQRIELDSGTDPSFVIIDEFVAMGFIYLSGLIPNDLLFSILALVLFRIFDIFKPFPINLLNQKKGAFFVIADDLLAALFTIIVINLLIFVNNIYLLLNFVD